MESLRTSATAPGKVILFGEHAVVYGRSALAAAVSDLRIQVELNYTPCSGNSSPQFRVILEDLPSSQDPTRPVEVQIPFAALVEALGDLSCTNPDQATGTMVSR